MTFPWSRLGIEPTENKRDIKKAYARKLKETRPDEHPEAFKQLHDAYKRALKLAETGRTVPAASVHSFDDIDMMAAPEGQEAPQEAPDEAGGEGPEPADVWVETAADSMDSIEGHPAPGTSADEVQAIDEAAAARMLDKVQALLAKNPDIHIPEKWRFIEKEPLLLDEAFRAEVGERLLALIIKHQATQMKLRGDQWHLKVGDTILAYLNTQFGWSFRFNDLLNRFDYSEIAFLKDLPAAPLHSKADGFGVKGGSKLHKRKPRDPKRPQAGPVYPFYRLVAMAIDLAIVSIPLIIFAKLYGLEAHIKHADIAFIAYLAMTPFFEASKWRATIGKRILGLQALTLDLQPLNFWQALMRSLMLGASIWWLRWINHLWGEPVSDFAAVIWPFIITSWIAGGRYPHDLLSFSLVLNYGRTR